MDKPEVSVKLLDELQVISVPPSGNSICRVSAENIWTLFPAADDSYFQTAVDTVSWIDRNYYQLEGQLNLKTPYNYAAALAKTDS